MGVRNVDTSSTASGPPSPQREGFGLQNGIPQDKEITSAQVLFPDRRTLDEVYAELLDRIVKLENAGTATSESSDSE